jgi:hypothetical protein
MWKGKQKRRGKWETLGVPLLTDERSIDSCAFMREIPVAVMARTR